MEIKPLKNNILFAFIDDDAGGKFIPKTAAGILLTNQDFQNQAGPRWGRVIKVGKDVLDVKVDDFILVESLQWTVSFKVDEQKMWSTNEDKVMAIAPPDTDPSTFYL